MRRRMVFAVVVPLVVVAALVGLRLTTTTQAPDEPTAASTVSWQDSLEFTITPDRTLRISTTRSDICLTPAGEVQSSARDGLQVGLERGAQDHCTRPEAGEPVDVELPASLDVTRVTRVIVVSGLETYPAYDVDNALYDSGVSA